MAAIGADGPQGYCIDRYEVVVVDEGGAPVTEKIGGAYYQDGRWPNPKRNHTPDFRGSIGFRCAAPLAP